MLAPKGDAADGDAEFVANGEAFAAEVKGAGRRPAVREPFAAPDAEADCAANGAEELAGPSTGTMEASGRAV